MWLNHRDERARALVLPFRTLFCCKKRQKSGSTMRLCLYVVMDNKRKVIAGLRHISTSIGMIRSARELLSCRCSSRGDSDGSEMNEWMNTLYSRQHLSITFTLYHKISATAIHTTIRHSIKKSHPAISRHNNIAAASVGRAWRVQNSLRKEKKKTNAKKKLSNWRENI